MGAVSSRPLSRPLSQKKELQRLVPAVKAFKKTFKKVPLSVDTWRPEVARAVLAEGADIINDITGTRKPAMVKVLKKSSCGIVLMHMQGTPLTMQRNPRYDDVVFDIIDFFRKRIENLTRHGIDMSRIVIDPGIGFGKRLQDTYAIARYIEEFFVLDRPVLLGMSRKSFLGTVVKKEPAGRLAASLAASSWVLSRGVRVLRTHDPAQTLDVIKVIGKIVDG